MAQSIAKANKAFITGEELILSASMDICREVLRKAATKKITQLSLSARTILRRIENVAGDIEAQLLEPIVKSAWFAIQCDELTDIDNKATLFVYMRYLYQEDIHEEILKCVLLLPAHTTANKVFKSLNNSFTGKLN